MNPFGRKFVVILIGLLTVFAVTIQAQDAHHGHSPQITYYAAADEQGMQQVFQLLLGSEQDARQLTHAATDVVNFGVAYDGLAIAYSSGSQLWLQPIHSEEAEALVTLNVTEFSRSPIFSQDGNYIAYADDGVWLYDLANRQPRQLLTNIPIAADGSNMADMRFYAPEAFVTDENGIADRLIVDIGVWEWNKAGVYNLATDELQELEGQLHTNLLPLADGQVLIYGNSPIAGEGSLYLAPSLDELNAAAPLVQFAPLTEATLFAEQALEIEPGIVRVFGSAIPMSPGAAALHHFYFDVNIATTSVSEVTLFSFGAESALPGAMSPDGQYVPVYLNALFSASGVVEGEFTLFQLVTGTVLDSELPAAVSIFHWQPRL
jgi:hypothetical protein